MSYSPPDRSYRRRYLHPRSRVNAGVQGHPGSADMEHGDMYVLSPKHRSRPKASRVLLRPVHPQSLNHQVIYLVQSSNENI